MEARNAGKKNNVFSIRKGILVASSGTKITVHDDNVFVISLNNNWSCGNTDELLEAVAHVVSDLLGVIHEITESQQRLTVSYFAKGAGDDVYIIAINVHEFKKPSHV